MLIIPDELCEAEYARGIADGAAKATKRAAMLVENTKLFGHERGPNCDICIQCQQIDQLVKRIKEGE